MRMRRKKYLDERLDACGNVNLGWLVDYAAEQRGETQQRTLDVRAVSYTHLTLPTKLEV